MKILLYGVGNETKQYQENGKETHEFFTSAKAMGKNVAECDMIIVTERQGWDYFDTLVNGLEDFEDQCIKHGVDYRPIVLFVSESLDKHLRTLRQLYNGYTFYSSAETAGLGDVLNHYEFEYDVSFLKI
jgi:hypothetical protein